MFTLVYDKAGKVVGNCEYSDIQDTLPAGQIECTQEQFLNFYKYKIYRNKVVLIDEKSILEIENNAKINECKIALQTEIDRTAQNYGYADMVNAASYAGYDNVFKIEAQALASWRSLVWEQAYDYFAKNPTNIPTANEAVSMMPTYTPPAKA